MTPFTLVMAYYENPGMLAHHLSLWRAFPLAYREALNVVIVDDGSPRWPALATLTEGRFAGWADDIASFQLWRMGVDVRWNQDACRNIGVREARTQWLLLTDMDHVVPATTWWRLMGTKLSKKHVYRFGRVSAPTMEPYKYHPNSWALTAAKYWEIGGYDEALAGNYGTDGDFLVRARGVTDLVDLPEVLVRYPREVIADASTTTLERKRPDDKERIRTIVRCRAPGWRPLHFSFPCEREL